MQVNWKTFSSYNSPHIHINIIKVDIVQAVPIVITVVRQGILEWPVLQTIEIT